MIKGNRMQSTTDASKDFDFQVGSWRVRHRRLRERLVNCSDWEDFSGNSHMRTILGGSGNVEDNVIEFPSGTYKAIALRSYDPTNQSWAIWWLASNDPHRLDTPVIGRFENGKGSFFTNDVLRGNPIRVRFLWLRTGTPTPRWEQAMSGDDGQSWETNWTMDFDRAL